MNEQYQKQQLGLIDLLIREGQGRRARHELLKLNFSDLHRHHLATTANLFRRVGLNSLGLKILNPIIRPPSSQKIPQPTQAELTEYGALLINLGVFHEGLSVLNSVDTNQSPSALLFKAFGLFNQWNYEDARPLLEAYIKNPTLNEYQRQIGVLNLMAVFVETWNFKLFDDGFKNLSDYLLKNDYKLLLGNLYEIKAQRDFFDGNLNEAKKSLDKSAQFLTEVEALTLFLIKKWAYIFNLSDQTVTDEKTYSKLCSEAILEGFSEGVRDLDFYRFTKAANPSALNSLYWGTPFAAYRKKILRYNKQTSFISERILWQPGKNHSLSCAEKNLNPSLIINPIQDSELQKSPLLMKLFYILSQDFYRKPKAPEIYSLLFPENYYNPISSPETIKQLVLRLRRLLVKNKWPVQITLKNGKYAIESVGNKQSKSNFAIELNFLDRSSQEVDKHLVSQKLRLYRLIEKDYTYGELRRNSLQCESTLNNELKKALSYGLLLKQGEGKYTRYKLTSPLDLAHQYVKI